MSAYVYVLACRECGDGEDLLVMPFLSAEDRGRWAAEHKRGTGHDRWLVLDDREWPVASCRDSVPPAVVHVPIEPTTNAERVAMLPLLVEPPANA